MIGVAVERVDGVPVARPRADVDAANARRVDDELSATMGPDVDQLVLDLSETRYIDSAGLDMLFRLAERLRQRRATLRLVIPADSQLSRLARIVSLPAAMPIHETLQEALAAAAGPRPEQGEEPGVPHGSAQPRSRDQA